MCIVSSFTRRMLTFELCWCILCAAHMSALPTIDIFGIPYVTSSLQEAGAEWVKLARKTQKPLLVAHSDVHVLTRALHDEADYGAGLRSFDFICPDGMPIVWLMRRKGAAANRLYGPDVMETMWEQGRAAEVQHFLLGGSEEAVALLQQNLQERYPGAVVAGHYCPPMQPWPAGEDERMLSAICQSGAHCVWVGLGCPRQERWLFEHRELLPPALYFGVGAAFNFHAGLVQQAPAWVRLHGLEWFYRLCKEPRRLFKRYLVHNSRFIWYCLTRKI